MSDFKSLNLHPKILNALTKKGYTTPTPIQEQSIPHLLEGRDLLGIAQTGTGKTAAFSLPILDNLLKSNNQVRSNNIRTLILTPTRELASQILSNIQRYGNSLHLKSEVIFGGVSINNQIKLMRSGSDIIVATPGRLLDLMNQGHVRLSQIEIFVLDEADRMLDMGFIHDIKKIIAKLPKERQTLLFSATMPRDIAKLADSLLNNPIKVEITPQATTVDRIDQRVNLVDKSNKPLLLKSVLEQKDVTSVLVFSKTKHGANRIVRNLEKDEIESAAIHGNKSQQAREKALEGFRKGTIRVLVATDIAARGIDIPDISHVINYDLPHDPESYVHRIGRTARAGKKGIAITFCDTSELKLLKAVEKAIKYTVPVDETHPFHGARPAPQPPKIGGKPGSKAPQKGRISKNSKEDHSGKRPDRFSYAKKKRNAFDADFKKDQPKKFGIKKKR